MSEYIYTIYIKKLLVRFISDHDLGVHIFFININGQQVMTDLSWLEYSMYLYILCISILCLIISTVHSFGGKFYLIDLCQRINAPKSIRVLNRAFRKQSFYSMYCAYVFSRETLIKSINKLTAFYLIHLNRSSTKQHPNSLFEYCNPFLLNDS